MASQDQAIRRLVIKVGGSLLAEPGAIDRVRRWLAETAEPGLTRVVIAGGGGAVEALRNADRANRLATLVSHRAAIEVMETHAKILSRWLPAARWTESLDTIRRHPPRDWVLGCRAFLERDEPGAPGVRLEVGWQTTSDSIAARIAEVLAARVVLLKHSLRASCGAEQRGSSAHGLVDPRFAAHTAPIGGVRLVGLMQESERSP